MTEVWKQAPVTDPTCLLVLLSLADQANDDGVCWPSVGSIAARCRVSERTVKRWLAHLQSVGILTTRRRYNNSNVYRITLAEGGIKSEVGVTHDTSRGDVDGTLTLIEPSIATPTVLAEPKALQPTEAQQLVKTAQDLTNGYVKRVPFTKYVTVLGVVKKALQTGYSVEQVAVGLDGLADDGRPVTINTLRIQMEGMPPSSNLDRKRKRQQEVLARYSRTEIEA